MSYSISILDYFYLEAWMPISNQSSFHCLIVKSTIMFQRPKTDVNETPQPQLRTLPPSLKHTSGSLATIWPLPLPARHLYNSRPSPKSQIHHTLHHNAPAMERLLRLASSMLLLLLVVPLAAALKFDLHAVAPHDAAKYERCVRNFVAKEQLVVVTAILDGYRGDGQKVDMHVCIFWIRFGGELGDIYGSCGQTDMMHHHHTQRSNGNGSGDVKHN